MHEFYSWASAQPTWLQVVIGLAVFFVGIPLILLTVWFSILAIAFVLGRIIAVLEFFFAVCLPPIMFPVTLLTLGALILEVSELAAWEIAFSTRNILGSSPSQIEMTFNLLTALFCTSILAGSGWFFYCKRHTLTTKILKLFSPRQWPREEA